MSKVKKGSRQFERLLDEVRDIPKLPNSRFKHVGVELEFISKVDRDVIAEAIVENGLAKYCEIKTDGSIRTTEDHPYNVELCVIARQSFIYDIVNRVCDVLNKLGCEVNDSCGLHVHLDMRTRTPRTAYKRLVQAQPLLESMVDESRVNKHWCARNECDELNYVLSYDEYGEEEYDYIKKDRWGNYQFDDYGQYIYKKKYLKVKEKINKGEQDADNDKYLAINPFALDELNTIECRLHEGTLESKKIQKWIKTLIRVADGKEKRVA